MSIVVHLFFKVLTTSWQISLKTIDINDHLHQNEQIIISTWWVYNMLEYVLTIA